MFLCRKTLLKNSKGFSVLTLVFIMLALFAGPSMASGQGAEDSFEVSDEVKLSDARMSCNYRGKNYSSDTHYNFEYPKIIIDKDNIPIIFFVNVNSRRLVIGEVMDSTYKIRGMVEPFSSFNHDSQWQQLEGREWPIVFMHNNVIHLVYLPASYPKRGGYMEYSIYFYAWDKSAERPHLLKVIVPARQSDIPVGGHFTHIYPYDEVKDQYMVIGYVLETHLTPLVLLSPFMSGDLPENDKNFSIILGRDELAQPQRIERKGDFYAKSIVSCASPKLGIGHCAWVRNAGSHMHSSSKETICYSINEDGRGWSRPLELYNSKRVPHGPKGIIDIFIACNEKDAYLLWRDDKDGVYFAEIQDGTLIGKTSIKELCPEIFLDSTETLDRGLKIAVDRQGNALILLSRYSQSEGHEMVLMRRVSGKWIPPIVVARGYIELSDMTIDSNGAIHITYTKGFACYYRKVSPRKNTEPGAVQ